MKRDFYSVEELAVFQAALGAADRETGYCLPIALMTSRLWEAIDAGERDLLRLKAAVTGCAILPPRDYCDLTPSRTDLTGAH